MGHAATTVPMFTGAVPNSAAFPLGACTCYQSAILLLYYPPRELREGFPSQQKHITPEGDSGHAALCTQAAEMLTCWSP